MNNKCETCGTELAVGQWPFCRGSASEHGKPNLWASKIYPYTTKNITGSEVEVTSGAHERALLKSAGLTQRDDPGFVEKEYLGYNWKTGKQEYREGSGQGLPGCWV